MNYDQKRLSEAESMQPILIGLEAAVDRTTSLSTSCLPQVVVYEVIVTDPLKQAVIVESRTIDGIGSDAPKEPSFKSALLATMMGLGGVGFCYGPLWAAGIWGFHPGCEIVGGAMIAIGGLVGLAPMALVHDGAQWMLYRSFQAIEKAYNK